MFPNRKEEQTGERGLDQLDDDGARYARPGKSPRMAKPATRPCSDAPRDPAHEEDHRHDHQPRCHHRRREAIWPSPTRIPPPAATSTRRTPQQLRKQPPPLKARIVEVPAVAELEHQPVRHARGLMGNAGPAASGRSDDSTPGAPLRGVRLAPSILLPSILLLEELVDEIDDRVDDVDQPAILG